MKIISTILLFLILFSSCLQEDENEVIREVRLIEYQRPADPDIFNNFLESENEAIRITVADAIAKIGNPVFLPSLMRLLQDKNPAVIKKSLFALGQIGEQDSLLFSLLDKKSFEIYHIQIIIALGRSKDEKVLLDLITKLPSLHDSLKTAAIQSISFIAPPDYKNRKTINNLRQYLNHPNSDVRGATAYFFSRHSHASSIHTLIRTQLEPNSVQNKYRLKAISRALNNYYIQDRDSALFDTLKQSIVANLKSKTERWRHQIYDISIFSHMEDSTALKIVEKYLWSDNPHLRVSAIEMYSKSDRLQAKQVLLKAYQDASWADKGRIILALSKNDPDMTYSFIQRNLDKGNLYFKQLLLRSLAIIKNRMAINQLRQFLQVPNPRLNYTAFENLWELRYIGYKQTKPLLLSGDLALTSIATDWIIEHPEWAIYDDLNAAYAQFKEPADVEVMAIILRAMAVLKTPQAIDFMTNVYQTTKSYIIAKQVKNSLDDLKKSVTPRPDLHPKLFVPDVLLIQKTPVEATIETEKGNISIQLLPDVAPLTVSNFIYLAEKGFYNNLTFNRVVSDFVVQGGDPRGDGWGGPNYALPCEYNEKPFKRGTIGMATAGKDTGSSQFFICHSEQPHLNRRYTVFGEVVSGMDVVDKIEIDDKIHQILIKK